MNTCKDCAHWGEFNPVEHHRLCKCPKIQEDIYGDDEMSYTYSEGGCMTTGKDFGCIHWKANDMK